RSSCIGEINWPHSCNLSRSPPQNSSGFGLCFGFLSYIFVLHKRSLPISMTYRYLLASVAALGFMLPNGLARAATIVDTGQTSTSTTLGYSFNSTQWLAGLITLDKGYTVTGVEIWLTRYSDSHTAGDVTVTVYGDSGTGIPDTGDVLFSTVFYADILRTRSATWQGTDGLNWDLG